MTTLQNHSPTASASGLVIDWSMTEAHEDVNLQHHISSMVAWVETLPRESGIHVRLPSVRHRTSLRRLQRTLQTLGCTVTCCMQPSH